MKTKRDLLVIDDEGVVTGAVALIGTDEGLSVDRAESAAAGLARMAKCAYRLVICDIMMEGCDGFSFLSETERRGFRVPIIMMTGYSTVENAVRSLQSGAFDFIAKPFTVDEVRAVVHRGLNYSRLCADTEDGGPPSACHPPAPCYRLGYVSWARTEEEGTVRVGVSDLFVRTTGGVQAVTLQRAGSELVQGRTCALISAPDARANEVMCPVSGRVIETNARLASDPSLVERVPYTDGWFYRIVPSELVYNLKWLTSADSPEPGSVHQQGEPT